MSTAVQVVFDDVDLETLEIDDIDSFSIISMFEADDADCMADDMMPSDYKTTRMSAWSDDYSITDLIEGAGLPNDVKVTQLSGRLV